MPGHCRGKVKHSDALCIQPDLLEKLLHSFYAPPGVRITFQVMTIAAQSTRYHDAIYAILKCVERHQYV